MGRVPFPSSSRPICSAASLDESRGEEPIATGQSRVLAPQLGGKSAHITQRGDAFVEATDLLSCNRQSPRVGIAAQKGGDLGFAFLGFERAYAIDNSAA